MFALLFIVVASMLENRLVSSQTEGSVAICTEVAAKWTYNREGQSPCEVADILIGQCIGTQGPFVTQLQPGNVYTQPSDSNPCSCSTVTYSLISACALCQGGDISLWAGENSSWSQGCTADITTDGSYPLAIPSNTSIPVWAYQNISSFFNPAIAEETAAKNLPDSTHISSTSTAMVGGVSAATFPSTSAPSSTSALTSPSTTGQSGTRSNIGIIIGATAGTLGGILILCLTIFSVILYRKKRQSPRRYSADEYEYHAVEPDITTGWKPTPSESHLLANQYTHYKLYDPSDPSTHPPASVLHLPVTSFSSISPSNTLSMNSGTSPTASSSRHTRKDSSESSSTSTYPRTTISGHSRQSSADTLSTTTKSLVSPVSSRRSKNFISGYHPSGIAYRAT